jgi:hypothetical protein
VDDLDAEGTALWGTRVHQYGLDAHKALGLEAPNPFVLTEPNEQTPHRTVVDWPGLPLRPVECVGREDAFALLDWVPERGRHHSLQEEYVEWRVVREGDRIVRVELTTELPEYWTVLAAVDPRRALELIASFAGVDEVDPRDVYGSCDPHDASTTMDERARAFEETMLGDRDQSPYNDGRAAITCMSQRSNTLRSLIRLVLAATTPRVGRDPWSDIIRCLTCEELIPLLANSAQLGRASDPVLAERLSRLAYEGRLVALDDPIGVFIQAAESTRLRTSHGEVVPAAWFNFDRGSRRGADGIARWQRVTLEPPPGTGLTVSDLIDVATEEPISHGAQVADLIQVAAVIRVSESGVVEVGELEPSELSEAVGDAGRHCYGIDEQLAAYRQAMS